MLIWLKIGITHYYHQIKHIEIRASRSALRRPAHQCWVRIAAKHRSRTAARRALEDSHAPMKRRRRSVRKRNGQRLAR